MIVELDHDVLFVAGENAPQAEFRMLNLRALREGRFGRHVNRESFMPG